MSRKLRSGLLLVLPVLGLAGCADGPVYCDGYDAVYNRYIEFGGNKVIVGQGFAHSGQCEPDYDIRRSGPGRSDPNIGGMNGNQAELTASALAALAALAIIGGSSFSTTTTTP